MIICDLCGAKRHEGSLFNLLKLQWVNVIQKQGWDFAEYQICSNCTKKLNDHIKKQIQKKGDKDE